MLYPSEEELRTMEYRSKKELSGLVRIVEVPGADVCACCGTHVENTGEVGIIKIRSMIHYKGGVRLSMLCGRRALLDYRDRLKDEAGYPTCCQPSSSRCRMQWKSLKVTARTRIT